MLAHQLYVLGAEEATGALETARGLLYLRRGYVRAVALRDPASAASARLGLLLRERTGAADLARAARVARERGAPIGRALIDTGVARPAEVAQALRRQTELRLEALFAAPSTVSFLPGAAPPTSLISLPYDPLPWLRERVAAMRAPEGPAAPVPPEPPVDDTPVRAVPEPPQRVLRPGEAALARALAVGCRPSELGPAAWPLLAFLAAVGALRPVPLGEAGRARRRALAAVHPDAHPNASAAERARLEARFRALATR